MVRSVAAVLFAIVACTGTAEGFRNKRAKDSNEDQVAQLQRGDEQISDLVTSAESTGIPQENIKKLLTTTVSLVSSLAGAFQDEPADLDYAFELLNLQGWQLVSLMSEDPRSKEMRNAKKAWRKAFGDMPDLVQDAQDAAASGETHAVIGAVQSTLDTALRTAAEGFPGKATIFTATADLVDGYTSAIIQFTNALPGSGGSLAQVGSGMSAGLEEKKLTALLTTGAGILASLISAFGEEPPDFEYALDSFQVQGWKMATIAVPSGDRSGEGMKKAKVAWDSVFSLAGDVPEHIRKAQEGDTKGLIVALLGSMDEGLRTCAGVWTEEALYFKAVADLVKGMGASTLSFSETIGLL